MKVEFNRLFAKDLRSIDLKHINSKVTEMIAAIETAETLADLPNIKKIHGEKGHYRYRLGNFRIGIKLESDTVVLVRILDRKDIYKYFP
ncbi:type II toxin-antitoxin system toxin RelE3 [soil metagenome]